MVAFERFNRRGGVLDFNRRGKVLDFNRRGRALDVEQECFNSIRWTEVKL